MINGELIVDNFAGAGGAESRDIRGADRAAEVCIKEGLPAMAGSRI